MIRGEGETTYLVRFRLIGRRRYISEFQIDMGRWENFLARFRLIGDAVSSK